MADETELPRLKLVSTGNTPREPKKLTDEQREALAKLLAHVFVMLRSPGYGYFWRKSEDWNDVEKLQATVDRSVAFGEAFHNVPHFLFRDGFDFDLQEGIMNSYLKQCPDLHSFILKLREIRDMSEVCRGR